MKNNTAFYFRKIWILFITAAAVFFLMPQRVYAGEELDPYRFVRISLAGFEPGMSVMLYQIATMSGSTDEVSFMVEAPFDEILDGYGFDLNAMQSQGEFSQIAPVLAEYAYYNTPYFRYDLTDENGRVYFEDLPPGLYLVYPESRYGTPIRPVLMMAPSIDVSSGSWRYNVDASSKSSGNGLPGGGGFVNQGIGRIMAVFSGFDPRPESVTLRIDTSYSTKTVSLSMDNNYVQSFYPELDLADTNISTVSVYGYGDNDYYVEYELSGSMIRAVYTCKASAQNSPSSLTTYGGVSNRTGALYAAKKIMLPSELFRTASDKMPVYLFGGIGVAAVLAGIIIIRKSRGKK